MEREHPAQGEGAKGEVGVEASYSSHWAEWAR